MIDFKRIPSPCYLLDEQLLERNLKRIDYVRRESGAEIIVALKACAMWSIFPALARHSDGATASSLSELSLVYNEYGAKAHTYAPIYTEREIGEILNMSSHITFNSLNQFQRYGLRARAKGVSCGLRVNPRYSPVETDLYNPCVEGSRLGIAPEELTALPEGIEGLHFHVLCESRPHHLRLALEAFELHYGSMLKSIKWVNMGGGHLMTHEEYNIEELIETLKWFSARHPHLRLILEPGSAFTWRTGYLVTTIEDIVKNGRYTTLMIDSSFACHMPDCLEMPYQPAVIGATMDDNGYRIGGNSCLAGDYMAGWRFDREPQIGDRVVFEDMIHYTMVKTTMFNGVGHPSIAIRRVSGEVDIIKEFGYEDFKNRMS